MKSKKLKAVLDEDIESLLQSLGQLELILNGEIRCSFGDELITLRNIQAIVPLANQEFRYVCDNTMCIERLGMEG
jgi:hypothetical protein